MNEVPCLRSSDSISHLSAAVSHFVSGCDFSYASDTQRMHGTISALHALVAQISMADQTLEAETIREILLPAREIHEEAPFVRRLQTWPRGYPGDFETIEILADARCQLSINHPSYWIEWYALNTAIAQQHRNKLQAQAKAIRDRTNKTNGTCRVLSVGCGGARDISLLDDIIHTLEIELVDMDGDALELALSRCCGAAGVNAQQADALRAVRRADGPFDIIVFGGLFDYLPDRYLQSLLRHAGNLLRDGSGSILFTNIATGNPYRPWLSYLADWNLIERSHYDLSRLWAESGLDPRALSLHRDQTGLAVIAEGRFP